MNAEAPFVGCHALVQDMGRPAGILGSCGTGASIEMSMHVRLQQASVGHVLVRKNLMNKTWVFIAVLYATNGISQPYFVGGEDPKPNGSVWKPVENMTDDFDGASVDLSKWQIEPVGNDWGWDGRAPGLFKASNVAIKDGKLAVTVGKLDEPVTRRGKRFTHQGGIVRSLNPGQVGWYYECKMKANQTVMSSTFWLMTKCDCKKKLELDIQECVGRTTEKSEEWSKDWDEIFHSNAIHRRTECKLEPERRQDSVPTPTKNWERYYVYGAWWKSSEEILLFLDGEHVYTINHDG